MEVSRMKLFLFLDDWLLDEKIDVVRRFAKAVQVPVPQAHKFARISILWDEKRKFFVGLGKKNMKKKSRDIAGAEYFFHEGKDGIKWNARSGHPEFHFPGSRARRLYVPGSFPFAGQTHSG